MNETTRKTLEQVVDECGRYPIDAFEFVRQGLNYTVHRIHGPEKAKHEDTCHVSGQQLCQGLRSYAIYRYGVLARVVLNHWGVFRTTDFGRIVFAMVESRLMQKQDDDDIRDFENVYDFEKVFDPPSRPLCTSRTVFAL